MKMFFFLICRIWIVGWDISASQDVCHTPCNLKITESHVEISIKFQLILLLYSKVRLNFGEVKNCQGHFPRGPLIFSPHWNKIAFHGNPRPKSNNNPFLPQAWSGKCIKSSLALIKFSVYCTVLFFFYYYRISCLGFSLFFLLFFSLKKILISKPHRTPMFLHVLCLDIIDNAQ